MSDFSNSKHFYLTLPSNSSFDYFGEQHPNSFKTKLEHSVSLDPEQWEVGLAEISYPKSWYNVPRCTYTVIFPTSEGSSGPFDMSNMAESTDEFGATRYLSPLHLIRDLQDSIRSILPRKYRNHFRIRHDAVSNRAKIFLRAGCTWFFPKPLGMVLGLSSKMAERIRNVYGVNGYRVPIDGAPLDEDGTGTVSVSSYTIDVNRLIPTIFVYCDLVKQQYVGDSYVQLLRTISVPDGGGDAITHKFSNIHYINLQIGQFESIEIKLYDSHGEPIDFKHGDVIVKLHFRKKEQ